MGKDTEYCGADQLYRSTYASAFCVTGLERLRNTFAFEVLVPFFSKKPENTPAHKMHNLLEGCTTLPWFNRGDLRLSVPEASS